MHTAKPEAAIGIRSLVGSTIVFGKSSVHYDSCCCFCCFWRWCCCCSCSCCFVAMLIVSLVLMQVAM